MKNVLVYILLVATLLPTVSSWGIIACYHINKDYIARVLCENRDNPQLHCDGKCYLAKRLKARQDRQDKETTRRVRNTVTINLFCSAAWTYTFLPVLVNFPTSRLPFYLLIGYGAPLTAIFQPPRQ